MKTTKTDLFDFLVCPQCRFPVSLEVLEKNNGEVRHGVLNCGQCSRSYSISNFIPFLLKDAEKDRRREGIAVDLKNAVIAYKKITTGDELRSGLYFDQDLQNRTLVFLDAGCGLGKNLVVLKNNGITQIFGFDLVAELLVIARESYGLKNIFVANASQIPFADGSVDRCLLYDTIEHCADPETVLREAYRVLGKSGVLYMNVPNARSFGDRMFRWGGILLYGKTSHIQKFTLKKITLMLERCGFQVEMTKTQKGIFVDYPQLDRYVFIKKTLTFLFSNEVNGWEFKLIKKR